MAKMGWGEFVIIQVIALLVLGPEKLPQAGRALGKAVRSVKRFISETTQELGEIEDLKNIQSDVEGIQKDLRTMGTNLEKSVAEDAERMEKDAKGTAEEIRSAVEREPGTPTPANDKPTAKEETET